MAINGDTLRGEGNDIKGQVKEQLGEATGDTSTQIGGILDQVKGAVQKTIGGIAGDNTPGASETIGKARDFAKQRPWATAALVGVVGMAVLNTLRGKRGA